MSLCSLVEKTTVPRKMNWTIHMLLFFIGWNWSSVVPPSLNACTLMQLGTHFLSEAPLQLISSMRRWKDYVTRLLVSKLTWALQIITRPILKYLHWRYSDVYVYSDVFLRVFPWRCYCLFVFLFLQPIPLYFLSDWIKEKEKEHVKKRALDRLVRSIKRS